MLRKRSSSIRQVCTRAPVDVGLASCSCVVGHFKGELNCTAVRCILITGNLESSLLHPRITRDVLFRVVFLFFYYYINLVIRDGEI